MAMVVRELIEQLQKEDPERLVVMSKDSEGNSFSPLYQYTTDAYRAETTWRGEIGLEELTEEAKKSGYTEEDVIEDGQKALVLWPTN
jgi:hypothetical protein